MHLHVFSWSVEPGLNQLELFIHKKKSALLIACSAPQDITILLPDGSENIFATILAGFPSKWQITTATTL